MLSHIILGLLGSLLGIAFRVDGVSEQVHLFFDVEFVGYLVFNLHLFVVIAVLVLQPILGVDLYRILIFFGLH